VSSDYTYRKLIVWDRAQRLALEVLKLVQRLPSGWGTAVIARQIIGSATSIGANIAEGHGRFTPGAHRNHLSIAKGSAAETDSWLDLLCRAGHLSEEEEARLHTECHEIMAMLTSKIRKLGDSVNQSPSVVREETASYQTDTPTEPPFPFVPEDYL